MIRLLAICALCALLSGCLTQPPPPRPVLIIGERVLAPDPGTTITIPPLVPPASQWYLVDDIGLCLWLNISPPASLPNQEPRTKNQEP
jgi:hypothetical protein